MSDNQQTETEPIKDEELMELVLEAQMEAIKKEQEDHLKGVQTSKKRPLFFRFIIWFITGMLLFSTFALIFQIYSIPAIEFIKVSTKLSAKQDIQTYKKAVVEISNGDRKGTGFAISDDGYIVTNEHVIENALALSVIFPDGGMYKAEVVESFPDVDLAILKVDGDKLSYLTLAESYEFTKNEAVYFIGNPLYFTGIANEGTVLQSTLLSDWDQEVFMIDAPVYRGNSGSPVINKKGQVIGIVFATIEDDVYGHVGLFIPVDLLNERIQK